MKQRFFLLVLIVAFSAKMNFAQSGQFTTIADNDPEASAILKKVKEKYQSYKEIMAAFSLIISIPEEDVLVQKGTLIRQGDMYYLKMPQQEVLCDGNSIAMVLHNNKEVQISDIPEEDADDNLLTPQSIFDFYDSGKYTYLLVNDISEKGRVLHQIEFKPIESDGEYFKIRLTIDKKTNAIVRAKAFASDGSRYTFVLGKTTTNTTHDKDFFTFKSDKFPGYYVEDLRE